MIKKSTIYNGQVREIKHIINTLYKIKKINRRQQYSIDELRQLVFNSKYGKQVIKQLQERSITCQWLKENNLIFIQIILGPKLKDN